MINIKFIVILVRLIFYFSDNLVRLGLVPNLYPLKTSENQKLFGVCKEYEIRTLAKNGLIKDAEFDLYLFMTDVGVFRGIKREH